MAFVLTDVNGHPVHSNKKSFVCQSVDDIGKLPRCGIEGTQDVTDDPTINEPCAIGSDAIVKTGEVYILWPDNEWGPF